MYDGYSTISELKTRADSGARVRVRGWVRTNRCGGRIGFIALSDGSCLSGCQIVYDTDGAGITRGAAKLPTGCAIEASGEFVLTPDAKQPFEIKADTLTLIGGCDNDYPMQK
ncbi:MAG: hypothetical protein LBJ84_04700 [Oscillospiraceae bacterium]|jgi:asparaginyl-tRNA synthetase|nr:hypothetical protein [Oscillospiraceae bacterium]